MQQLTLYYIPTCPYCRKVLQFMKQNNVVLPLRDRNDPCVREELLRIGGKTQVPCLIMGGEALYESDDIIRWLKENWKK